MAMARTSSTAGRAAESGVVRAQKRTFGGLPGVWCGGSHPKRWQTSPDTVSAVIGRGSGYPIRRIFRDNPPNVRGV